MTSEWYREKRRAVEARFETATPAGDPTVHVSPSGRWSVEVQRMATGPSTWAYSVGTLRRVGSETPLAVVRRNFGHFPLAWCETHPSGHAYLVCGEDYQGQTVIDLDTLERVDFAPDEAKNGGAFCGTEHHPSPDGTLLFVVGCVWACPYELLVLDFARPMRPPWPIRARLPELEGDLGKVIGFVEGAFVVDSSIDVRKSDGAPFSSLDDAAQDELLAAPAELIASRTQRISYELSTGRVTRRWLDET